MAAIPLVYNLRNLWVRKVSALLTLGGIALAVAILLVVMMLVSGLRHAFVESGAAENAIVIRKSAQSETMSGIGREGARILMASPEIAMGLDGNPLVASEVVAGVNLLRLGQKGARSGSNVTVRGITPVSLLLRPKLKIVEGRAPAQGSREILAGDGASRGFEGCQLGGTIQMVGIEWTVVGVFTADGAACESELWADVDLVSEAFGREGGYSSVTMALKDSRIDIPAMTARWDADPRLSVEIKSEREYYTATSFALRMLISILGSVLIVLFTLGATMGAMVTMFAFVGARTREIGTLRALGFPRRAILFSFLMESMMLGLVGAAIACLPALFLQQYTFSTTNFTTFTDVTWHFRATPLILGSALLFGTGMGAVGGLVPALRAARLPIISALRAA